MIMESAVAMQNLRCCWCCCCIYVITARVVITQGASLNLNLFSSREAEYEQRAQLLKRLTFTIYCSEIDQYQRHMPDIQGNDVVAWPLCCLVPLIAAVTGLVATFFPKFEGRSLWQSVCYMLNFPCEHPVWISVVTSHSSSSLSHV